MTIRDCKYFPCHKGIDESEFDCSFCFCPFYECNDKKLGKRLKNGKWDCSNCTVIHKKEVVEMIKKYKDIIIGKDPE